jgi:hypothetical protein
MPPRRGRFSNDPYYQIYHQTAFKNNRIRPGFLEHRNISETYEYDLDLDERERREFFADYLHFMVSDRYHGRRNDPQNPFFQKYGIDPEQDFDWHAWRLAMGYPEGNRK